jgi:hypothetical protein
MAGCKFSDAEDEGPCGGGFAINEEHCYYYTPPTTLTGGCSVEFVEYPEAIIRASGEGYNLPKRRSDAVMYPFTAVSYGPEGPGAAHCGKVVKPDNCTSIFGGFEDSFDVSEIFLDYTPTELSFDYGYSDTWFAYVYDTSDDAGHLGTACYHIEEMDEDSTTTTSTTTTDPTTGLDSTTSSSASTPAANTRCIPCAAFNCTAASTSLSYTADENLTGDPDCPHPTLFGFGTDSNKIAFTYNTLSTQVPDGIIDFEVSFDGTTYVNAWDATNNVGIAYTSSQSPWQGETAVGEEDGDEGFTDFQIYNLNDGINAFDFRVKFSIGPIYDDSGATTVFSGTRWIPTEILNNGTGWSIGDVIPITFQHRLPDNTLTTLTLNIRVTAVGNIPSQQEVPGFDLLRPNDTINGHTITRTFHTEIGEFPYHIIYLDGSGADFVKDAQYTSNRAHVITAVAGYGIKDRAILVGLYEFLDKSIQFMTGDVNRDASDVFGDIKTPRAFISVNENGGISDINISAGAYSLDTNSFYTLNDGQPLDGYSSGNNIATSGGNGSGLTVDIDTSIIVDENSTTIADQIDAIRINNPGSGYQNGDIVTISGGGAKISILEVTSGGENLNLMNELPDIKIGAPSDNNTAFSKKGEDDGHPTFKLNLTTEKLKIKILTKDGKVDAQPIDETNGGDNQPAKISTTIAGGKITNITITKPGRGYTNLNRPDIIINNFAEFKRETIGNDSYRDNYGEETRDVFSRFPESRQNSSDEGYTVINESTFKDLELSFDAVPSEREIISAEPVIDIKMDPDRESVRQKSQQKYTSDITDPLRQLITPDYDVSYLDNVELDGGYIIDPALPPSPFDIKGVIRDDLPRTQKTVTDNIDAVTQEVYPDYRVDDETKVESCVGSFTNLPIASKFTKYIVRQFRPDPTEVTEISVKLSCTPQDIGCAHFACAPPFLTPNSSTTTSTSDEATGSTESTTVTRTFTMSPIMGPGCQEWTAEGKITMWHDLTRAAQTVVRAAKEYGNPFAD